MSYEQKILATDTRRTRLWAAAALLFALVTTSLILVQFLINSWSAVRFPGELDYGEGIVWEQMRLMVAGRGYGSLDGLPAIVFHYPPAFHLLSAAIVSVTGLDALAAGRSVSIGSTLAIGLFAGLIAAKTVSADAPAKTAAACGLLAGLAIFCFGPIAFWGQLMRVDMLSIAFSFAGLFIAMLALKRPPLIIVSAMLFVAAVFTKQTSVVAPAAVFLTFLLLRPRLAWALLASCVAMGLAVLGALALVTDGGFIRHIFLYNVNRFDPWRLTAITKIIVLHLLFAAVIVIAVFTRMKMKWPHYRGAGSVAVLRQRLIAAGGDSFFLLVLAYALLATLMTLSVAKSGSNVNYFVEGMAAVAILIGISARDAANTAFGLGRPANSSLFANPVILPMMIGLQALMSAQNVGNTSHRSATRVAELNGLEVMVRSASRPVISDDMVLLVRSGVPVQWEPAIFAELASTGAWDEAPFVERIRAGHFAFFVTVGTRGEKLFDSRYRPAVADAMEAAYPIQRRIAGYTIHLPATGSAR